MEANKIEKIKTFLNYIFSIFIISIIITEIILSILPPTAVDALNHHLAIPKLWLRNGGFYEIKWAAFSYYPMNVDLLYLIPLYFHNDIIPNFIHLGFGLGTAYLIYCYLNSKLNRLAGLLGVLVFISTPIIMRMSTVAYVDLGLVFFTTASILAILHWRNGKYKENKWLFISAVAMGLALGTKYNALIAWFFISLAIVFLYSKDTEEQLLAIRYGAFFFLVSLLVFSPWLIKNYLLTGNPLFPLFNSIFNLDNNAITSANTYSIVSGDTNMGLFKMRAIMYEENFWETLLIPVRFFFQGQDYSDRYFDGVLNPILIIFIPFAFMKKSFYDHKLFFVLFSVFFILTAFFLDQLRIRYIIPAIPFLTILTVMGIINIFTWSAEKMGSFRYASMCAIILLLLLLAGKNIIYLNKYFHSLQPINYVFYQETRDEYLKSHIGSYEALRFINEHTSPNAKIRLLFLAGRGYYLERTYEEDVTFGMDILRNLAANTSEEKSFQKYIDSLGCTHLLVRKDMFIKFLNDNYPAETVKLLLLRLGSSTKVIYNDTGYAIYQLISSSR